jgi:hypothetical protein
MTADGQPPAWLDALDAEDAAAGLLDPKKLNGHARTHSDEPPEDTRPEVRNGKDSHRVLHELQAALAVDPLVYQRAFHLVTLVGADGREDGTVKDTPTIREMTRDSLIPRLSRHVKLMSLKKPDASERREAIAIGGEVGVKPEWTEITPPPIVTGPLLACGLYPDVKPLVGITETPIVRPDGSIHATTGYDPVTGYVYAPSIEFPILDRPTQSDAALAYAHLADAFIDFPYVDESHRSATVAAVLTVVCRTAVDGAVPCWLFDAASKRSGKSLQANVVSYITTGRAAAGLTFPDDDDELEKVLAGCALEGSRIVNFDNIAQDQRFGGAAIDKYLTSVDTVQLRILGKTGNPIVPWRGVIMASGNNVNARGDMLPRVLSPRIESPLEHPEARPLASYVHPERGGEDRLCGWARDNRASLVADAITIVRAYLLAGRPAVDVAEWGGFSAWTRLIAYALVWAGAPNPLGARRGTVDDDDPRAAAERGLVLGWVQLCRHLGSLSTTASIALTTLYPPPKKDEPPDGFDDLREAIQALTGAKAGFPPSPSQLSGALRSLKGRPLGGARIAIDGATKGKTRWRSDVLDRGAVPPTTATPPTPAATPSANWDPLVPPDDDWDDALGLGAP